MQRARAWRTKVIARWPSDASVGRRVGGVSFGAALGREGDGAVDLCGGRLGEELSTSELASGFASLPFSDSFRPLEWVSAVHCGCGRCQTPKVALCSDCVLFGHVSHSRRGGVGHVKGCGLGGDDPLPAPQPRLLQTVGLFPCCLPQMQSDNITRRAVRTKTA